MDGRAGGRRSADDTMMSSTDPPVQATDGGGQTGTAGKHARGGGVYLFDRLVPPISSIGFGETGGRRQVATGTAAPDVRRRRPVQEPRV